MSLNLDLVGQTWESEGRAWTSTDAILYALGVGAGAQDPLAELSFTTENSHGVIQQVLPTFAVMLGGTGAGPKLGDFDLAQLLHAEQTISVRGPIPTHGRSRTSARVTGIYDKGSGALIVMESSLFDADTGRLIAEVGTGVFIRGEGGFGGERGTSAPWAAPDRPADHVVVYPTRPDQALLYRLSGDRNPLHSDPWLAGRAGFERPILHGLCSYGFTGRALLHTLCGSDPAGFGMMSARFAAPVLPGQELAVHIWDDGETSRFVTKVGETVVLDRGRFARVSR
ncbi:MaoC/PaaZ C-terminal domain-containing protein [Nonomuraea sp. NEAU-A123]|uniref:MaoC/PaaZ C-terminal domain-containing protein n=1 Tax=Nonomuraea sp. NEAU-A123 TaxID=2839649 RepID=UPI001BE4BCB9|nr:MaoC/PaaZ C-terminal domain-containing protein [Nonomuraea sp. NEAU-A123]MBT2233829.1 MaoC family dehydratase N-terminal domain-containing protein [Nonomuraea sp. NEAU-A123]